MSRLAIALLAAAAIAAGLVARMVPWVEWLAYVFIALTTAGLLDRRARAGHPVGRAAVGVAVLLGGGAAATWVVSEALAPFAVGGAFAAAGAALVALRHDGGRLLAFLGTRAAFYGLTAAILTLSVVAIVVVGNVLALRHPVRVDMTAARIHSLSEPTLSVLHELRAPVVLHAFFRPDESALGARLRPLLERYETASSFVRLSFHDPDREPRLVAELAIQESGARVVAVSEKGMARILPSGPVHSLLDTADPRRTIHFRDLTEADVTNGILRAVRTRPRLCFTTGHAERDLEDASPAGYASLKRVLEDHNLEPAPLALAAAPEVPAGCRAVVVAGAKAALFPKETAALRRYIERGGALLVFAEPGGDPGTSDLLAAGGVLIGEGSVTDPRGEGLGPAVVVPAGVREHPATAALAGTAGLPLYLDGARPVDARQGATSLLESTSLAWAGPAAGDPFQAGRDRKGPLPLAAAGSSGRGRVGAVGDADFAANRYVAFPGNRLFAVGLFRWAVGDEKLVTVRPHAWRHSRLTWTESRRRLVRVVTQAVLPGLAVFVAVFLWRLRRRG